MESIKKTGEILSVKSDATLKNCLKLAELERRWPEIAGPAIADRSSVAACEFSPDGMLLTINVNSAGVLPAIKSRRNALVRVLSGFLGVKKVTLDIRVGKVEPLSTAKEPLPAYKRRVPILISADEVEITAKRVELEVRDGELAREIARIKVLLEKRAARGRR